MLVIHAEYSDRYPYDENFNILHAAATEAFQASGFQYIDIEFKD